MAWSNRHATANDDYIISPRLDMADDFVISFWTRGYWWRYEETLMVGYSTDGKEADDFIWIGEPVTVDYDEWTQIVTPVPQQARYVAIRCVSDINNYLLAIDDIFIGMPDNIPGVTRQEPARVPGAVLGYEVYLDDEKIASTTETSYMLRISRPGSTPPV